MPKKVKKPEKYITERIEIEKLVPGGQALGTLNQGDNAGKKIFLWNALPDEIVSECLVTKSKSHYLEAIATKIDRASSARSVPRDDCYLATSPWQIMDYDYELAQKSALLDEIYRQQGIPLNDVDVAPVQTDGVAYGYRNKMEYALYYDHADAKIYPAFHQRGTHRKLSVSSSSLERPEIWQTAQRIIADLNATGADARRYQSLLLRTDQTGTVSGGLYENHQPHPEFPPLEDELLGQRYSYSPNGFFQINLPVYALALTTIKPWIKTDRVLDLYAGVGTIGLSVARDRELTLVECDHAAYRELATNCHGLASAIPVLAKSEDALDYIAPDQTVIVDPPRAGCRPELIDRLREVRPAVLVYLSCNPITQARDLSGLLDVYTLRCLTPFNFFPRTPHLENLAILERK